MLFLKGGAIVPTGPVMQHVGEAKPNDTVRLLIALDDEGIKFFTFLVYRWLRSTAYTCHDYF